MHPHRLLAGDEHFAPVVMVMVVLRFRFFANELHGMPGIGEVLRFCGVVVGDFRFKRQIEVMVAADPIFLS